MTQNVYGNGGNPAGGSGAGRRDGTCTPTWLADLIGPVDVDPCSNERSHVRARVRLLGPDLPAYVDGVACDPACGLEFAATCPADWESYINPPYSRGQVIRWVRAYAHTRFRFLLRFDTSTAWFDELCDVARYVWFPRRRRVDFDAPPGVDFSSNPFPHGLFLRDEPNAGLVTMGRTFSVQQLRETAP